MDPGRLQTLTGGTPQRGGTIPAGSATSTEKKQKIPIKERDMEITYNNIKSAINRLKPYKLYGRKDDFDR